MSVSQQSRCDVLVVGARTTGLMLAVRLARQGLAVRIVDRSPGIDAHSRATLLHSRSLELLDNLGLADEIAANGQPLRGMRLFMDGQLVLENRDPPVESAFPHGVSYSQARIERLLEGRLAALGVTVDRACDLVGLDQDDAGVRARLRHAHGGTETLDAAYLVGCDGAHSATRHLLGIGFPGAVSPHPYVVADVVADNDAPSDAWFYFLHRAGSLILAILDGGRRQIIAPLAPDHPTTGVPTLADIQALVDTRTGGNYRLSDPRWLAYFHINYRVAERLRVGRAFLAGDAAHIHSPFAGHGMNTGMQDACNLAWKLTLAVRGRAAPALLDSYEAERLPVAQGVVSATQRYTEPAETYPTMTADERATILAGFRLDGDDLAAFRRNFEELDLDYGASPLCRDAAPTLAVDVRPGLEARNVAGLQHRGARCDLFQHLGGPHHCLMVFAGADPAAAAREADAARQRHGAFMDVHLVARDAGGAAEAGLSVLADPDGALAQRYGMAAGGLYLVRPDGYVGYRAHDAAGLDDYVCDVLVTDLTAG
ncbi:MAG: FAD-dependent monooxygenase [Acuticoccus sp.]